jgi:ribosomal protein S18 acetylase RimI-like enzyme
MIRTAVSNDIPSIRTLMTSVPGFWHADWREDAIDIAIQSAGSLAFVYEENSRLLGFACGHDLGFLGYLSALVIAPRAQGRGLGSQLVEAVQQELVNRGCGVLISDVWKNSEGFYRNLGWRPPDVILLRKKLRE